MIVSVLHTETQLVEKYSRLIVDGHGEKCPWRRAGCDGKFRRILLPLQA